VPDSTARRFFQTQFRPYQVVGGGDPEGLFTGYFEPQLQGARQQSARFSEPLHRRPPELVRVDLSAFSGDLSETIYGTVKGQQLVPYATRKEIDNGALAGRGLALAWVDDPIDKFFLQIQGSGRVLLPDSTVLRVGYDGENGHPYRAIGRDLIAMGEVPREEMSMQAIRAWMEAHPDRRDALMYRNPSYIFFRSLGTLDPGLGPLGAQGVALTPEYSLAVDPRYIPYGAPLWLQTRRPAFPDTAQQDTPTQDTPMQEVPGVPMRRLMIAQDTGGAIRGAVRGDVFWGAGDRARSIAGRMQHAGRYAVLLPAALDPVERVDEAPDEGD
jgi:membrane-bound lytic murein transglycosylase A